MISLQKKFKNFGLLEILVSISIFYVVAMLIWTATTRNGVLEKANNIKSNHKNIVKFLNDQINICSQDLQKQTLWGEDCNSTWTSSKIVDYILKNIELKNPYSINKPLIQSSSDPRIDAEGKAGQSTNKGVIFVSSNDFNADAGSEWIVGTCVKSPCVAAGNNELVSIYR
ncbi:hypothetical protein OAN67_02635 [Pelagibacteraceae bacterium]|jgi:hypothetical protein|nr:hypothetical protein [Pelagibacteraceae bacterium]